MKYRPGVEWKETIDSGLSPPASASGHLAGGSAGPAPTPNAQGETFFLQDLLTVMNAFGQTGEVVNVRPTHAPPINVFTGHDDSPWPCDGTRQDLQGFLRREMKVLMRDGREFAVTLSTERLHPRTTSGDANRVTIR
jgi:hypothetical protein